MPENNPAPDEEIGDLLRGAGALPAGLPPGARHRLETLAASGRLGSATGALPSGIGIAAGVLLALGAWASLRSPGPVAWERPGTGPGFPIRIAGPWRPVAAGSPLEAVETWREIRLADGSTVDAAPGTRLVVLSSRPGRVVSLEEGTAFFSVPSGKGDFRIEVPGGGVEVAGTAFGITVRNDGNTGNRNKGGTEMTGRNPWMIGAASAAVAVAVTSGAIRFLHADATPAQVVKAGSQLEIDRSGAARLATLQAREDELARREAAVAKRERAPGPLAEAEKSAPSEKPRTEDPKPVEASPQERIRKAMLESAARIGGSMASLSNTKEAASDAVKMKAITEMMSAMATFQEHEKDLMGDLAVDTAITLFDSMMPEGIRFTDDQKARFRQVYLDAERLLDANGIPKHLLFPMNMHSQGSGIQAAQQEQLARIQEGLEQQIQGIRSPEQKAHLESMKKKGGEGKGFRVQIGQNPGPAEEEEEGAGKP